MKDIAILVEGKYVNPKETDWYVDNVLLEDKLLMQALKEVNLSSEKVDWSEKRDWSQYKAIIFSSVWDYFHRYREFVSFLDLAEGKTHFINPISLIRWNMDKHYLNDLQHKGIPIVSTYFIEKGDNRSLKDIHGETGWEETVIKPCVSGAARHTYRLEPSNYDKVETIYRKVISEEAMMLQPFQRQIITRGEVSHIVIDGQHSHAILKTAKKGDYRVQDDFGGTIHPYMASDQEKAFAIRVVSACDPYPAYARVDVVWDNNNELAVGELELIEPELWLRKNPLAAQLLAKSVQKLLYF